MSFLIFSWRDREWFNHGRSWRFRPMILVFLIRGFQAGAFVCKAESLLWQEPLFSHQIPSWVGFDEYHPGKFTEYK
ncbi:MAG: hypothetical protein EBU14_09540 [Acetobacteraceae bacterium]|nr:hypothetical protein [Acetobacteraceae bacterium]